MSRYLKIKNSLNGELKFASEKKKYSFKKIELENVQESIPSFINKKSDAITEKVSKFYNKIKFPNYDEIENYSTIYDKGMSNQFSRQLNTELGWNIRLLELGCGTGQLSLFLARGEREVHGVDISHGSLGLAEKFRYKHNLENIYFLHMDVFNMPYKNNIFDVIISNGVLHHTKNAKEAFKCLVNKTKPGGYLFIGLYHKYGRFITKIKQHVARIIGEKILIFDHHARKLETKKKKESWIRDQFFNPHETSHEPLEVLSWFDENNVDFINLLPHFSEYNKPLLEKRDRNNISWFNDFIKIFDPNQIVEGGFFIMIGKKL